MRAMPLLIGTWRLFLDGVEAQLTLSNLEASGKFRASVSSSLVATFFPHLSPLEYFELAGEGFWNEIGQEISFTLGGLRIGLPPLVLVFGGRQVRPASGADPAQDRVWTVAGEWRAAHPSLQPVTPLLASGPSDETARRFVFGWYAQIVQVL